MKTKTLGHVYHRNHADLTGELLKSCQGSSSSGWRQGWSWLHRGSSSYRCWVVPGFTRAAVHSEGGRAIPSHARAADLMVVGLFLASPGQQVIWLAAKVHYNGSAVHGFTKAAVPMVDSSAALGFCKAAVMWLAAALFPAAPGQQFLLPGNY